LPQNIACHPRRRHSVCSITSSHRRTSTLSGPSRPALLSAFRVVRAVTSAAVPLAHRCRRLRPAECLHSVDEVLHGFPRVHVVFRSLEQATGFSDETIVL
jgi:hypothetical protein